MENKVFCRTNIINKNKEKIENLEESRSKLVNIVNSLNKKIKNKKRITNILNAVILLCFSLAYKNETQVFITNFFNFNNLIMIICPSVLIVNIAKYFKDTKETRENKNELLEKIRYFTEEIQKLNIMNSEVETSIKEAKKENIEYNENVKKLIHKRK